MAQDSKIEWTHHTANLWWGCTEVHEGCENCYARVLDNRWNGNHWGKDSKRRAIKSVWKDLNKYQKLAKKAGEMHRVFVGSMMDIFERPMDTDGMNPDTGALRDRLFEEISGGKYPNLIFLLLTKRPANINRFIPTEWKTNPPVNVMFGTSVVNQQTADKLIQQLYEVNGKRFLSVEPQLEKIDLRPFLYLDFYPSYYNGDNGIDWVIQGGESGHNKRPFDTEWAYYLKQQCEEAGVPYFFKQIDKIQPIPDDLMIRQFPITR